MLNKKIINELKESNPEIELDLDDKKIHEIKSNLISFINLYCDFFNSFYSNFKESKILEVINLIEVNKKINRKLNLIRLDYKPNKFEEARYKLRLQSFLEENFDEIDDFFDLCLEIYSDEIA